MFYFTTDSALKIYPKGEKMTAVVFLDLIFTMVFKGK
jgi:hypothetical protein